MAHQINEKDRFKTKTWVIPLANFKFHHKSYEEKIDHRNFFGRDEQVKVKEIRKDISLNIIVVIKPKNI